MGLESDIESIQHRFAKRLPGLYHIKYDERLLCLRINSLKTRRSQADLLVIYKLPT